MTNQSMDNSRFDCNCFSCSTGDEWGVSERDQSRFTDDDRKHIFISQMSTDLFLFR
jgi:hypothetical protein